MKIKVLNPDEWKTLKPKLIRFVQEYGELRITVPSMHAFIRTTPDKLSKNNGTQVVIAATNGKLVGVSFVANYGKDASIIVVSPPFRGHRIGSRMLQKHITQLHSVYCQVAEDNLACMNTCIQAGLRPVAFRYGTTGKPSLLFSNEQEEPLCQDQP